MSVEVLDESGTDADVDGLAGLVRFVLDRLRVHPRAEMCLQLVDEDTIALHNEKWMDATGPTDVLAFPIDELVPGEVNGSDGDDVGAGDGPDPHLGDVALCPVVAARQAAEHGHSVAAETEMLCVHGVLHLLGYDHADPDEQREMFALQARLLAEWQGVREGQPLADEAPADEAPTDNALGDRAPSHRDGP